MEHAPQLLQPAPLALSRSIAPSSPSPAQPPPRHVLQHGATGSASLGFPGQLQMMQQLWCQQDFAVATRQGQGQGQLQQLMQLQMPLPGGPDEALIRQAQAQQAQAQQLHRQLQMPVQQLQQMHPMQMVQQLQQVQQMRQMQQMQQLQQIRQMQQMQQMQQARKS